MTTQTERRASHPYHMYDAVQGQPGAIARVLEEEARPVADLAVGLSEAERIHVVGIGTSWHAALVGEHLLRTVAGREDARAWNSFEFCEYPPKLSSADAVIVLSHRGTKLYSAQALEMAQSAGARTAVVSALGSQARTDLADTVLRTCPEERSSAFTISHSTAMTMLSMLAVEIGIRSDRTQAHELARDLKSLPELVASALETEADVKRWTKEVAEAERLYFTGWGPNASTAYEVALKIKETSYVIAEGLHLEQYLHGPYVATHPGCLVTLVAPPGPGRDRARTILGAAKTVGAGTALIAERGDATLEDVADTVIRMPAAPESLSPIVYLVPLQLLTYWLAVELGCNPDVFRLDNPAHEAARRDYQL